METFTREKSPFQFTTPGTRILVLGVVLEGLAVIFAIMAKMLSMLATLSQDNAAIQGMVHNFSLTCWGVFTAATAFMAGGILYNLLMKDTAKIRLMVRKGLFCPAYGNPLNLNEGEITPKVTVRDIGLGRYEVKVTTTPSRVGNIQSMASCISSCLNRGKYERYAVTQTDSDPACNAVTFMIEDVTIDRSLVVQDAKELKGNRCTMIPISKDVNIDLTTSGSILVCGKTRSGKSTGVIAILLSVLQWREDEYGSKNIIIDPKCAELSCLPHVVKPSPDGDVREILMALCEFEAIIRKRQEVLNSRSTETGDAVKWWDAHMHPCFLFIDEYISARSMFPAKPSKDDPTYCVGEFDAVLKRIVTMGASAGCYAIISIPQASVAEAGLPSMIKEAMGTKILFRPTMPEARLLWDADKLRNFSMERVYGAGDAWFSSTDGIHDNVSFIHFPVMKFPVYAKLGALLRNYHMRM